MLNVLLNKARVPILKPLRAESLILTLSRARLVFRGREGGQRALTTQQRKQFIMHSKTILNQFYHSSIQCKCDVQQNLDRSPKQARCRRMIRQRTGAESPMNRCRQSSYKAPIKHLSFLCDMQQKSFKFLKRKWLEFLVLRCLWQKGGFKPLDLSYSIAAQNQPQDQV